MDTTMIRDEAKEMKTAVDRQMGMLERQWDKMTAESRDALGYAKNSLRSIQGRLAQAMERAEDMTEREWEQFKQQSTNLLRSVNEELGKMEIK